LNGKLLLVAIPDQAGDPKDDGKQEVRCCSAHRRNFSLTGLILSTKNPFTEQENIFSTSFSTSYSDFLDTAAGVKGAIRSTGSADRVSGK